MQKATTLPTAYPPLQLSLPVCIHSTGFQWHLESCTKYPLCYSSLSDSGPQYQSKVLWIYTSLRQLCSSSDSHTLCVLSVKIETFGQRSFSYAGSVIWNKLSWCQDFTIKNVIQASPKNPSALHELLNFKKSCCVCHTCCSSSVWWLHFLYPPPLILSQF